MNKNRDRNHRQRAPFVAQRVMDAASGPATTGARTTGGMLRRYPASRLGVWEDPPEAPPRPGYTRAGSVSAQAMKEAEQSWADVQVTSTFCMFCDWAMIGTALKCREEAKAHREREHPEACIRKPRGKGRRITKRKLRTAGEEEQIKVDAAEANRVRAEREQNEMLAKIERGRERDRAALAALDGAV